jgi:uncharacterized protein YjbJ (UPF0337 family)
MDWDQIQRNWKQVKLRVKQRWDRLTNDDLKTIDGRRKRLEERIHQRYGFSEDHVRKEIDDWLRWQDARRSGLASRTDLVGFRE